MTWWHSGHTNKLVNQKSIRKAFSSVIFFLGLVEGFFVCVVWGFWFFFKEKINIKESSPPQEHLDKF